MDRALLEHPTVRVVVRPGLVAWLTLLGALGVGAGEARAQNGSIVGTQHDLSQRTTDTDQICIFCHTPHRALTTMSLWNRRLPNVTTYNWGNDLDGNALTHTVAGTQLPTTLAGASRRCLGCHDGSIALGEVLNGGSGQTRTFDTEPPSLAGTVFQVGVGGNMGSNHPISIPYAGQSGYMGRTSAVPATAVQNAMGTWWRATNTDCDGVYGVCTEATGTPLDGRRINLVPDRTNAGAVGVECVTCHEPHNRYRNGFFLRLRISNQSALCRSCHNK